jgi:hypothetical protein
MAVLVGAGGRGDVHPGRAGDRRPRVYWPSRAGRELPREAAAEESADERAGRPVRTRVVGLASRRPLATAVGCVLVLGAAATGLARLGSRSAKR